MCCVVHACAVLFGECCGGGASVARCTPIIYIPWFGLFLGCSLMCVIHWPFSDCRLSNSSRESLSRSTIPPLRIHTASPLRWTTNSTCLRFLILPAQYVYSRSCAALCVCVCFFFFFFALIVEERGPVRLFFFAVSLCVLGCGGRYLFVLLCFCVVVVFVLVFSSVLFSLSSNYFLCSSSSLSLFSLLCRNNSLQCVICT
jgi:hypothetical protein